MDRKEMPGAMPADVAERLSDRYSRAGEAAYLLWLDEESENKLKDPDFWFDILDSMRACDMVSVCLSEIYTNSGNTEEMRKALNKLFYWARGVARDDLEAKW